VGWLALLLGCAGALPAGERVYENRLKPLANAAPLLADYPEWVEPITEPRRFVAPPLVDEPGGDLDVRAWRFSYNARGIIEMPNRLRAAATAVIMVHPWGIDDGQGWHTPAPAGIVYFGTPERNHLGARHTREVVDPFIKRLRDKVGLVLFSLRGKADPLHRRLYRSISYNPTDAERAEARRELDQRLRSFAYQGQAMPERFSLSDEHPVADYFRNFRGSDSGPRYNPPGFWELPIPVTRDIEMGRDDIVLFDAEGYDALRTFLRAQGIRHVLLTGYHTDMCFMSTCAGYQNLSKDFNVFLVGDATLATFPAHGSTKIATSAHIAFASINQLITQISWVRPVAATK